MSKIPSFFLRTVDLPVGRCLNLPLLRDQIIIYLNFGLLLMAGFCGEGGPSRMVCPRKLMDPTGFQEALGGGFPTDQIGNPVETQVSKWYSAAVSSLLCDLGSVLALVYW